MLKAKKITDTSVKEVFGNNVIELKRFHFLNENEVTFNETEDEKAFFKSLYYITDHTKISKLMVGVTVALGCEEYECVGHCKNLFEDFLTDLEFVDVDKMNKTQLEHYENAREYLEILWGWDIAF